MLQDKTLENGVIVEVLTKKTARTFSEMDELMELEERGQIKIYLRTQTHWRSLFLTKEFLKDKKAVEIIINVYAERLLKESSTPH